MIAIVDYGMGNIHSVKKALESMGAQTIVTDNPKDLSRAEKIVFPGVGSFGDAVVELKKRSLDVEIRKQVQSGKIFLGICLGMQVLFEKSMESQKVVGLGLLKGSVDKFEASQKLKVPHMGWNQITKTSNNCQLLKDMPDNSYVYFCHSYYANPADKKVIAASCDYGDNFAAVVCKDNLYGLQFHPEKSQAAGLKIVKNFVEMQC